MIVAVDENDTNCPNWESAMSQEMKERVIDGIVILL